MNTIKVLVVDDHTLVREGIAQLLHSQDDIVIVGEATNGQEAVEKTGQLLPKVVLMDIAMPVMNGIQATRQIKKLFPEVQVVALTMYDFDEYIMEMFSAGALSYILKTAAKQDLISAIRCAAEGQSFLYPPVATKLVSRLSSQKVEQPEGAVASLTPREREILKRIAEGSSTQEIAQALGLSLRTVQTHRANIMKKLGHHNTAELVRYAIGAGLVEAYQGLPGPAS
ncbi:MAG: response regulator transcription factor [Clostridia bacterium]|nr:MAG: response regulator transcription factor [Clostridia bacterium]